MEKDREDRLRLLAVKHGDKFIGMPFDFFFGCMESIEGEYPLSVVPKGYSSAYIDFKEFIAEEPNKWDEFANEIRNKISVEGSQGVVLFMKYDFVKSEEALEDAEKFALTFAGILRNRLGLKPSLGRLYAQVDDFPESATGTIVVVKQYLLPQ